jgi:hypothetical protein
MRYAEAGQPSAIVGGQAQPPPGPQLTPQEPVLLD